MRTASEIEESREQARQWDRSVREELAPVVEAYAALQHRPADARVEDYGVGPLLTVEAPGYAEERADGSYHYVYAFVASPIINESVAAQSGWTVGVDYSDGAVITVDLPEGTEPARLAQVLLGLAHVALATYEAHITAPRRRS